MMKMKWALIVLTILAVTGLSAQTITVGHPNPGEQWQKGSSRDITWTASGISSGQFKITLYRGRTQLGVIATELNISTRSYRWTVGNFTDGSSAPEGEGYSVKVKLMGEPVADFSEGSFEITSAVLTVTGVIIAANDYEVESMAFQDFNGNNVFRINGTLQFPYNGGPTPGTAIIRVKNHPGLHIGTCDPRLLVRMRYLSTGTSTPERSFPLRFNAEHIAEIRYPFRVQGGMAPESDINIQARLAPMSAGCDKVPTNNSKDWNLNLHPYSGNDLTARSTGFTVKKIYANTYYRWHFIFKIGVINTGSDTLRNATVNWRLMEDGTNEVYSHTYTIDSLNPGAWHDIRVDKRFGGTDKRNQRRPRLRAGHRYVVLAHVDLNGAIAETNENNNRASRSVTLPR